MKRKIFVSWLMIIILLGLAITACTPEVQTDVPEETTEAEAETQPETETAETEAETQPEAETGEVRKVVYFIGFGTGTAPDQVAGQEALIEEFNSTHDDIEVELMIVPHEEAYERFGSLVAGGNAPEVIGAACFADIGLYADQGAIEDLTPYMDEFDSSIYYPVVENSMKTYFPDGIMAIPFGIYPSMVFYNQDHFDAAGLEYPSPSYDNQDWTYEKIREYGMQMTIDSNGNNATMDEFDPTDIVQYGFDDSWINGRNLLSMFDSENPGKILDDEMKTVHLTKPEYIEGLQWMIDGIWEDHFIPDSAGQAIYSSMGSGDPFGTGMSAMFLTHTWYMPEGLSFITFPYDIVPVPINPSGNRVVRTDFDGFAITKQSDEKEAAFEFVTWLVQKEQIVDVCQVYGCLPPVVAVEDEFKAIMESKWPGLQYDVIYDGFDFININDGYTPENKKINDVLDNMISIIYTNPDADAETLLTEAEVEIQAILDAYWADK